MPISIAAYIAPTRPQGVGSDPPLLSMAFAKKLPPDKPRKAATVTTAKATARAIESLVPNVCLVARRRDDHRSASKISNKIAEQLPQRKTATGSIAPSA